MEKFEEFSCKVSGINPFTQPKVKDLTLFNFIMFVLRSPLFVFFLIFKKGISGLLNIDNKNKKTVEEIRKRKNKKVIVNSVSYFDFFLVQYLFGNEAEIIFPEVCSSNGKALMSVREVECDYFCYLSYDDDAVYKYGNYFFFLIRVVSRRPRVVVKVGECKNSKEFASKIGIPQTNFSIKDKTVFYNLLDLD